MPRPLALTGDPVEVLAAGNRRLGDSAETHRCHWDGAPPDYCTAIEVLDRKGGVSAETSARK